MFGARSVDSSKQKTRFRIVYRLIGNNLETVQNPIISGLATNHSDSGGMLGDSHFVVRLRFLQKRIKLESSSAALVQQRGVAMASQRKSVMLEGRLNGMGQELTCTISALKVSLTDTSPYEYARLIIFDRYEALPDGRYDLTFEGRTIPVERRNGAWLGL